MIQLDTLRTRPQSIFHLPDELLKCLQPVDRTIEPEAAVDVTADQLEKLEIQLESSGNACRTCNITLDEDSFREHFKTDWHRYNIKRKLVLQQPPVALAEFETMLEGIAESISGSESSSEEEQDSDNQASTTTSVSSLIEKQKEDIAPEQDDDQGPPRLLPIQKKFSALRWFMAPSVSDRVYFGVYKSLVNEEDPVESLERIQASRFTAGKLRLWTFVMIGGGHFAGAVVDVQQSIKKPNELLEREVKMVAHKTFHRYTTRRKQGGAQSANDMAKGKANSAGAQIRRYNERMLQQEVRQVLSQWREHIADSEFIFVHAPSNNRKVVFGYEEAVLDRANPRVKTIPFPTRRPTLNEVRRVFIELSSLRVAEMDPEEARIEKKERVRTQFEQSRTSKESVVADIGRKSIPEVQKLIQLVAKQGKEHVVLSHIRKHEGLLLSMACGKLSDGGGGLSDEELRRYPTLLHLASHHGHAALVSGLIRELGADPTIKNDFGKTAYEMAKDKETRNAFRRCMCDLPDQWDWVNEARVPSPLTREAELEQIEKERKRQEREMERRRKIEEGRRKREEEQAAKDQQQQQQQQRQQRGKHQKLDTTVNRLGGSSGTSTPMNMANMSPEARMRLEREMRARAAEERLRRLQNR